MIHKTLDLQYVIRILKKRHRLILLISLATFSLVLFANLLISPTYEAVTSMRVKAPSGLEASLMTNLPGSSDNRQNMENYAEMLKSRTVVEQAINKVYADKGYIPQYEQIASNITAQPSKTADILYLRVQATSPEEAQLLANTLSETLISVLTDEQGAVREFIGQRLKESRHELEKAERALEEYKRSQKMIAPDVQSRATLDKMIGIDRLMAENTVSMLSAQAKLSSIERQLAGEDPDIIADNSLIQQYKGKLAELEVELVSNLPKYSSNHPKVISIRAAIDEVKTKLNNEVAHVIKSDAASGNPIHQNLLQGKITAEAEVAAVMAQRKALEGIMANSERELAALPTKEQGITRLVREAQVAQEIYLMLDKRYEEARISEVMHPSNVKVLDPAIVPEMPIKPQKVRNALVGAMIGLFMGIVLVLILEYINWTIRNDQEAKELLGSPILGVVPDFGKMGIANKETFLSRIRKILINRKTN